MIFHENDGTFIKPNANADRHYTAGQGITVGWRHQDSDPIANALGIEAESTAVGLTFVQQIFTPTDFDAPFPPDNDRPHAGYLYLGGFWQRQEQNHFDHFEIDLGVVGPSSWAEGAQEWIHDIRGLRDPDWRTQLGDELAVNFSYRRKWRTTAWLKDSWAVQAIPEIGVDVGNVYRRAHAGLVLRGGFNIPDDFGPAELIDPGALTGRGLDGTSKCSFYVFAKATGRYVEWNTFIEGSNTRNPSRSVSLEPWLGELSAGIALDFRPYDGCTVGLTYSQRYYTREFEEQTTDDSIGAVAIRLRFDL